MYMVLEYERCQALMVFQKFNPLERSIKFHSFLNCLQIHKIQQMQQRHYLSQHSRVHWGCPFCYKYRTRPISLLNQHVLDSHMSPRLWERWSVSHSHQFQSMAPSLSLYKCLYRYLLMMNFLSWWDFVMFCNVHTTPMMLSLAPKFDSTFSCIYINPWVHAKYQLEGKQWITKCNPKITSIPFTPLCAC